MRRRRCRSSRAFHDAHDLRDRPHSYRPVEANSELALDRQGDLDLLYRVDPEPVGKIGRGRQDRSGIARNLLETMDDSFGDGSLHGSLLWRRFETGGARTSMV